MTLASSCVPQRWTLWDWLVHLVDDLLHLSQSTYNSLDSIIIMNLLPTQTTSQATALQDLLPQWVGGVDLLFQRQCLLELLKCLPKPTLLQLCQLQPLAHPMHPGEGLQLHSLSLPHQLKPKPPPYHENNPHTNSL